MTQGIHSLLDRLWSDYIGLNPQAQRIRQLLADRGDRVRNDHIALRTLRHPKLGIDATARLFERHGYRACDEYDLPGQRLYARYYESDAPDLPKILISELVLEDCSRALRGMVDSMMRQVRTEELAEDAFVLGGRLWHPVLKDSYAALRRESEYAAWVAAFGLRASHFTVAVNDLDSFDSLVALNAFLKQEGVALDHSAGEIRGSSSEFLEQSCTAPTPCEMQFADGVAEVPGGCYQFAYRHPLPSGERFPGFIASAVEWMLEGPQPQPQPSA